MTAVLGVHFLSGHSV